MMPTPERDDLRMLRHALDLAKRHRFHVFPVFEVSADGDCTCQRSHPQRRADGLCGNPGKHPRTMNGWKNATADPEQITRWWRQAPQANIGIACGPSDLVVVDVDPRSQGDHTLAELEREHGQLPDTPRQLTGGGGVHYLYRRPDRATVPHCRGGGHKLGMGVDVKADDGYIIASPSSHVSGRSYQWDTAATIDDIDPSPLPPWILAALDQRARVRLVPSSGDVLDAFLGRAFHLAGWLGRPLGPDKAAALCPWEDEHTGGSRYDGSTLIFAAQAGHRFGWWHCSHAHCSSRRAEDVLAALPQAAKDGAKQQLSLPQDYDGTKERRGAPITATPDGDDAEAWRLSLRYTSDGRLTRDPGNAALLLANLEEWQGVLEYDAFADRIRWVRPAPPLLGFQTPEVGSDLGDHHFLYVGHWLSRTQGLTVGRESVHDAVVAAARQHPVHPLRSYLTQLEWDGTPRVDRWLSLYLGATDDEYSRAVGAWWLVSAIARALQPGCQADHLLILEGEQGKGKSSGVRALAGAWYLGRIPDVKNKDAAIALRGKWIVEIGELDAFRGSHSTAIKDWSTQVTDHYRPPYGRVSVEHPRQCVFIGTTNEHAYLRDATGARRFWPVQIGQVYVDGLTKDRDQLWAEARVLYERGTPWWPSATLQPRLRAEQEERFAQDEWEGRIREAVMPEGDEQRYALQGVTAAEVLGEMLKLPLEKWGHGEQLRVTSALRRLGWAPPRDGRRRLGSRVWMPGGRGLSP